MKRQACERDHSRVLAATLRLWSRRGSLETCASSDLPLACLPSQTGDLYQVVFKTSSNSDLFWHGPHAQAFCLWSGCRDKAAAG